VNTATQKEVEDVACERCGSFEVFEIAGKFLCADCVALAGCGCAGHGAEP
jgi:protein-arginine kinase activator protein McsA